MGGTNSGRLVGSVLNPERNAEICRRRVAGELPRQIVAEMNLTPGVVMGVLRRSKLTSARPIESRARTRSGMPAQTREYPIVAGGGKALEALTVRDCHYPQGTPGHKDFRFCGAPVVPGRPYCLEHCEACYQKPVAPSDAGRPLRRGWAA